MQGWRLYVANGTRPIGSRRMAARMLSTFLESVQPGEVIAVEQPFAVEMADGILVTGIVDLVEIRDGRFWIVDNKTSKNAPSATRPAGDDVPQLP